MEGEERRVERKMAQTKNLGYFGHLLLSSPLLSFSPLPLSDHRFFGVFLFFFFFFFLINANKYLASYSQTTLVHVWFYSFF